MQSRVQLLLMLAITQMLNNRPSLESNTYLDVTVVFQVHKIMQIILEICRI